MAIVSSGQLSMGTLADNKDSASRADLSLSSLSTQFASGSAVGDVDGNGSANQTADRNALNTAGFAISEFYDAEFVNEFYDTVVAQLADGTAVTDDGYVDGESGRISFNVNDATLGNSYTVGLKNASTNAVIVDETATKSGTGTKTINFTAPSIDAANNFYYPFVSTGTFENAVGSNIDHYDAIGAVSITDPSDTTVAASSTTHDITHARSIADESSINDYNWTFAKSSGDGSNPNPTSATTSTPTVRYTGPGIYTIDLRVDGIPSQARNSTTAAQVSHRIDYAKSVSINNPSSLNEGSTITATVGHKGFSSGIDVDLIQASDNSVLLSNDHTTDSRITEIANQDQTFTAPARTDSTLSVKVKAFDGSDAATSNAFNIYPLISQQFASGDLSFGASAVTVGQNVTLDVGNDVTDNIVGYAWSNQGTGNMTVASGNASAGDTDGSANDSVSIIDLTDQSHPTVNFDTAEENKTIRLSLFGRLNQTATADKNIDVELVDATTIGGMISAKGGDSVTISGSQAGFSGGVTFGIVTASADTSMNVSTPNTRDDTTNSKFSSDNWSGAFTLPDSTFTRHMEGRVIDRSDGTSGQNRNTSAFTIFPKLTTSRNVIDPQTNTIFSSTNNTDTSTFPRSFTFSSPTSRTDNISSRTYSESDSKISITANATPASQTATQATIQGSTGVGSATVTYTVVAPSGDGTTQTTATTCGVTINYSREVKSTGLTEHATRGWAAQMTLTYILQGFTATQIEGEIYDTDDLNNKLGSTAILQTGVSLGAAQTISGTQTVNINPATTFSVSSPATADGEDGFKIKLIGKDSGGTIQATVLTDAFELFPTTSTAINCQLLLGAKFGYNSLLNAADRNQESGNADSTVTVHHIGTIVDSSVLYTSATLATAYDGDLNNNDTQHFFSNSTHAFIVNDSGVVSSKTSRTPSTPASIAVTSGSLTDDTWDIAVTGNTTVARTVRIYYGTSQGSTSNNTTQAAASQGTSVTSTKSGFDFSALAGQDIYISARFENDDKNGSQLSPADKYAVPGNVSFGSWSGGPSNLSTTGNVGANATDETTSGNSHIISITNNTGGNITISGEFVSGEPSSADGELHYEMAIGSAPSAGSYNRNTVVISNGATSSVYVRFELTQTKPDATSSGNASFRVVSSGGFGNSANIAVSYTFSEGG